jgi:hypothetical protein
MPTKTSKHSDSNASALRELRQGDGQKNQQRSGNGYGHPSAPIKDSTETDGTRLGASVISRNDRK